MYLYFNRTGEKESFVNLDHVVDATRYGIKPSSGARMILTLANGKQEEVYDEDVAAVLYSYFCDNLLGFDPRS